MNKTLEKIFFQKFIKNIDIKENIIRLSSFKKLDFDFVESYPDLNWDYFIFSENNRLDMDFLRKNIHHPDWDFESLSENPFLDIRLVLDFPEKDWDWYSICACSKNIWKYLEKYFYLFSSKCFYKYLSCNPYLDLDFLEKHLDSKWDFLELSYNPALKFSFVKKHLGQKWNYTALSYCQDLDFDFVEKNIDKDWSYEAFSKNPNLDWNFFLRHQDKKWNLEALSYHPKLNWDYAQEKLKKWELFVFNPELKFDFMKKHMEKIKNLEILCNHINLDFSLVKNSPFEKLDINLFKNNSNFNPFMLKNIFDKTKLVKNQNITFKFLKENKNLSIKNLLLNDFTLQEYLLKRKYSVKKIKLIKIFILLL